VAEDRRGLDLARALYLEVVEPALAMPHTACLIGEGSEVLGYDTGRSADHECGPRLQVFVPARSVESARRAIEEALPHMFHSLPTRWFSLAAGRVAHHVEVDTADTWLAQRLPTLPRDPTTRPGSRLRNSTCCS
jgi:hypothetical protein